MSDITWVEDAGNLVDALAEGGKAVVLFTAPAWCPPCIQFEPHYKRAASEEGDIRFFAVDVDKAPWAMLEYGVRSVPTCFLYEGEQQERQIKVPQGALPFLRDIRS